MAGKGDPPDQHILEGITERVDLSPAGTRDFLVSHEMPKDRARRVAKQYTVTPRTGVTTLASSKSSALTPAPAPKDVIRVPTATATVVEQKSEVEGSIEAALLTADRDRVTVLPIRAQGRRSIAWRAISVKWRVVSITIGVMIVVAGLLWIAWKLLLPMSGVFRGPPAMAPPVEVAAPAPAPTTTPSPASPAAPESEPSWSPRVTLPDGTDVSAQ